MPSPARDRYGTYYGKYVREEAMRLLPSIHQEFTDRVRSLPLKSYILGKKDREPSRFDRLAAAYNRVVGAYAGDGGFLDRHVAKVLNYLAIATMAGRNQSTSGHERSVREETWNAVAAELKISISERIDLIGEPAPSVPGPATFDRSEALPVFRPEQVARHHRKSDGWIIIGGLVFDVTSFVERHPGGPGIIRGYLGRDATKPFSLVSAHHTPSVRRMLRSLLIGRLADHAGPPLDPGSLARDSMIPLLDDFLRICGLLEIQYDHSAPPTQRAMFRMQAFFHFVNEHLDKGLAMIRDLDLGGPPAPPLEGLPRTWSPAMRRANWLDEGELG